MFSLEKKRASESAAHVEIGSCASIQRDNDEHTLSLIKTMHWSRAKKAEKPFFWEYY